MLKRSQVSQKLFRWRVVARNIEKASLLVPMSLTLAMLLISMLYLCAAVFCLSLYSVLPIFCFTEENYPHILFWFDGFYCAFSSGVIENVLPDFISDTSTHVQQFFLMVSSLLSVVLISTSYHGSTANSLAAIFTCSFSTYLLSSIYSNSGWENSESTPSGIAFFFILGLAIPFVSIAAVVRALTFSRSEFLENLNIFRLFSSVKRLKLMRVKFFYFCLRYAVFVFLLIWITTALFVFFAGFRSPNTLGLTGGMATMLHLSGPLASFSMLIYVCKLVSVDASKRRLHIFDLLVATALSVFLAAHFSVLGTISFAAMAEGSADFLLEEAIAYLIYVAGQILPHEWAELTAAFIFFLSFTIGAEGGYSGVLIFLSGTLLFICFIRIAFFLLSDFSTKSSEIFRRDANSLLEATRRRPILFLRSFTSDSFTLRPDRSLVSSPFGVSRHGVTIEEVIGRVANLRGPFIKVSSDAEPLYSGFAATEFRGVAEWKEYVSVEIIRSECILVLVDTTDSLLWEMQKIVATNQLKKTVFLFPQRSMSRERLVESFGFLAPIFQNVPIGGADVVFFDFMKEEWTSLSIKRRSWLRLQEIVRLSLYQVS